MRTMQKKLGDCDGPSGLCTQIDLVYPLVVEGEPAVEKAINSSILQSLIQNFVFEEYKLETTESRLDMMPDSFLLEWKKSVEIGDTMLLSTAWEVSVTGETGLHTPKVAAVSLGTYSYAGGAHPNTYVTIFNFDLKTGRVLTWEDFTTNPEALKKLAEMHFKMARDLPPSADLVEEGYFWDESFTLPQNFELKEEGIYFWYNPYEAASYSEGPTDYLITWDELGKLVNRERIF